MFDTPPASILPSTAPLSDPLYYLRNLQTVQAWCLTHHSELLLDGEIQQLETILGLPESAQALLARLIMRKGDLFRSDKLNYDEIGDIDGALSRLSDQALVDTKPSLDAQALAKLCRRDELLHIVTQQQIGLGSTTTKPGTAKHQLLAILEEKHPGERKSLQTWHPQAAFTALRLDCMPLLERVQLMFFGNMRQDLSDFVLVELGLQKYETVLFDGSSRAFSSRAEVTTYLALHHSHQRLFDGEAVADILTTLPGPQSNPWLEHRRQKLLFGIARETERQQDFDLSLRLYRECDLAEARVRQFRVHEKHLPDTLNPSDIASALERTSEPEPRLHLQRIQARLHRKHGQKSRLAKPISIPEQQLVLHKIDGLSVEQHVVQAMNQGDGETFYVENRLFTSLLGLLIWPVIFAPLPGAFFHPFQSGPADLFRPDFVPRRRALLEHYFDALKDGRYVEKILSCARAKRGVNCSLLHWETVDENLLEKCLASIPASSLEKIFRRQLLDLRRNRSGLPDLIRLFPEERRFELIEVKGPGDRLQDHQRLWLEFFIENDIPVQVAKVSWTGDQAQGCDV